jgi:stearoyl-CoA desaturase (delta-9 desaturase)
MHRMHHAYADTDKDPHSPANFRNVFAMMWHSRAFYLRVDKGLMTLEKKFLRNLPEWRWFDKFAQSYFSRIPWVAAYVVIFILLAPSPWFFALLPVIILLGPVHGAIINWFAHKYGFVNFKLGNTSRNLLPVDVLMLGEAYHNDHHHAPSRANFGKRWFQVDPVYYIIKVFNRLRIVRLVRLSRTPPASVQTP